MIYYILSGLIIALLFGYVIYLRHNRLQVVLINKERQKENDEIEQKIIQNRETLERVKESIVAQNNVVQSLTNTAEKLRESAEQQAKESAKTVYARETEKLEKVYQEFEKQKEEEFAEIAQQVLLEQDKLAQLEAKQLAYIQAQQRQDAIAADEDYYRLAIDELDVNDISLLRELQKRFFKKEAIDKLIWETYYKPAYDALMARLFTANKNKICGIYKITDLTTGQAYIGQSVDVKERFRQHIKTSLAYGPATNKLYQTMQKTGQYNFIFEILEEVPRDQLNERETYWIDFYKTKDYGLNSTRGGSYCLR